MSNKKSTLRALVFSGLAMLLSISMLVGTTFAWFTDSVSSGVNRIIAGNLDVEMNYWNDKNTSDTTDDEWSDVQGADSIFSKDARWEPGYTEVIYLQVKNVGDLAIKYRLALNILGQVIGTNKEGKEIKLSDYINFGIVPNAQQGAYANRADAIAAVTEVHNLTEVAEGDNHAYARRNGAIVAGGEDQYFALVVWMPTTVGNEANHNGIDVPSIDLDITLVATQYTDEEDSFDNQYDKDAQFPVIGSGTSTSYDNGNSVEVHIRNNDSSKIGSAVIPAGAMADGVGPKQIKVEMVKTETPANITVAAGQETLTYDITVDGLKDNNDVPVKVAIRIVPGLDPNTVKVYHYDQLLTSTYNHETGYATFETTSFSPFTVVYGEAEVEIVDPDSVAAQIPVYSDVCQQITVPTNIEWGSYGDQWSPTAGLESNLDATFEFTCPDGTDTAAYKDWFCDFYVKLNADLGENEIFLGGNYGDFGWIGFHNGDVTLAANEEIPLLGSVSGQPWTYSEVYEWVGTFICGVGDVDGALAGKTFTVMLRLTNPDNEAEYFDVVTVNYTFADENSSENVVITGYNNGN